MGERCSINKLNTSFTFIIPVIDFQSGPPKLKIREHVEIMYKMYHTDPPQKEKEIKKKSTIQITSKTNNII